MRTPQKLIDKALRTYDETKSAHKAAKRSGLAATTVYRILKEHGIETVGLALHRQRIRKLPETSFLVGEYESGLPLNALAKKYGCELSTVAQALKKGGAKMRPRGNSERAVSMEEAASIHEDYLRLGSQAAVAALRGTSQVRISRAFRLLGIKRGRNAGSSHPSWKGGRCRAPGGYISVFVDDDDPLRSTADNAGRCMEHRLVMARALGRPLTKDETVHHVNGDRTDNRLSNLQLRFGRHGKGVAMVCSKCGSHEIEYKELSA